MPRASVTPSAAAAETLPLGNRALAALRALRPHQWAKNILVFLPVLAAHRLGDPDALAGSAVAFVAFGLVASAVYVLNDVADLQADRAHPRKRTRPFASGALPVAAAAALVPALLLAGGAAAWASAAPFRLLLAAYFLVTLAYSFAAKRWPLVDVFLLAGLYTARIYAGAFATGIPVSEWLASFSMFLFLSLAFLKRASELLATDSDVPARGYMAVDRDAVFSMGTAAGYLSVLVLALYVSSPDVRRLYARPQWLWALCPLVLYWVSRMWLRARRGEVDDDPVLFALKDPATYLVGVLGALALLAGT
jgi:4-hydroxybenzoate polyprenyltransferase